MGFFYIGPVDGHALDELIPVLEAARDTDEGPVLVHVVTEKGRGYGPSEASSDRCHSVGKFDVATGVQAKAKAAAPSYTKVFAEALMSEAARDERIVAVTAAMPAGTGLDLFGKAFPDRTFDVGIAEQHAVTFAAGMAAEGYKPFCAIYSTFLQRGYDQVVHDVALQSLPVRFAIDRAGFVGADGPTHAGSFDIAYLACLPGFVVMAAADEAELAHMVATAAAIDDRPSAFRYPRGEGVGAPIPLVGRTAHDRQGPDRAQRIGRRAAVVRRAPGRMPQGGRGTRRARRVGHRRRRALRQAARRRADPAARRPARSADHGRGRLDRRLRLACRPAAARAEPARRSGARALDGAARRVPGAGRPGDDVRQREARRGRHRRQGARGAEGEAERRSSPGAGPFPFSRRAAGGEAPLRVILAKPRGFCAGVVRAIEIVERSLEKYDAPVYVRHEIVHNKQVVDRLKAKGARFVEELSEIPDDAVAIFSAHGVPKRVEEEAAQRRLTVHNATCPLVTKVHNQARRYVMQGRTVILIGHAGHPEVEGTLGQVSAPVTLVQTEADVATLEIPADAPVGYITQTTLSVDDTRAIIAALERRFSDITGPDTRDICYATQNRQWAVRELCKEVDVVLVVGARNSSNSNRLCEIAAQMGVPAYLIADSSEIRREWVEGVRSVGVTAGASAPEDLVSDVVRWLANLRPVEISTLNGPEEMIEFKLPPELAEPARADIADAGASSMIPFFREAKIAAYLLRQRLAGRERYPLVLMLEPLFRCNLACAGCGKIDYPDPILNQRLSVQECLDAVDECGAPLVAIPGGEPLIHREIGEIVDGIVARKKFVSLCTNALLLEKKLHLFKPSPYLFFSVHLDGLREVHDQSVAQAGVFDIAVAAIKKAKAEGFAVNVNATIFDGHSAEDIAGFLDFAQNSASASRSRPATPTSARPTSSISSPGTRRSSCSATFSPSARASAGG